MWSKLKPLIWLKAKKPVGFWLGLFKRKRNKGIGNLSKLFFNDAQNQIQIYKNYFKPRNTNSNLLESKYLLQ